MSTRMDAERAADAADLTVRGRQKYLTFHLGNEEYGIRVLLVQEIIRMLPITRVPRTPHFVRGVTNLRGRIVPVMDLRARFGMDAAPDGRETCIVVVRASSLLMGFVVDGVRDMLDALPSEIEPVPNFGVQVDTTYLTGVARRDNRVVLLVDIERVVTRQETNALQELAHSGSVPHAL